MLSRLSVRCSPESRLRLGCSSRYLRISPLLREFHSPLLLSRQEVSTNTPRLSRDLSPWTFLSAYMPFTPNKSEQRLPPTYYRGCWHVVSRGLFLKYRPFSSFRKEVYDPRAFFPHAASLHQAFAHCARFPAAASRRSGGRVSVPLWPIELSLRLSVDGLVSRYLTNYLIEREPLQKWHIAFPLLPLRCRDYAVLAPISRCCPPLKGRSLTRYSAVRHLALAPKGRTSFDLHALSAPPAFVLSQDQTLQNWRVFHSTIQFSRCFAACEHRVTSHRRARRPPERPSTIQTPILPCQRKYRAIHGFRAGIVRSNYRSRHRIDPLSMPDPRGDVREDARLTIQKGHRKSGAN